MSFFLNAITIPFQYILPEGTVRESYKTHEEVLVPPSESKGVTDIEHVYVKNMDEVSFSFLRHGLRKIFSYHYYPSYIFNIGPI